MNMEKFHVVDHPLIKHKLSIMRDEQTLIDWISEIDKDQRYYVIVPTTDTI